MGGGYPWHFRIDENLSPAIVDELSATGLSAEWVPRALAFGADDLDDILPYCLERDSILVTNIVRDFNPAALDCPDHAGIVLVFDKDRPARAIAGELCRMVGAYGSRDAPRGFEIADEWTEP